ncbi:MAG: hypothetical protein NTZ05_01555, partial [Chloroflexi bacterium]|nr:hypothetical protein [Chloroflexota bacterium]
MMGLALSLALLFPSLLPVLAETAAAAAADGAFLPLTTGNFALAPSGGPAGSIVSATGVGFPMGVVPITWDTTTVMGMAAPDAAGNFVATFPIPRDANLGGHTIAVGGASKTFTIDPDLTGSLPSGAPSFTLSQDAGPSGASLAGAGANLGVTQALEFRFSNPNQTLTPTAGTPTTSGGGSFSAVSFNVPGSLPKGSYAITAIAAGSGRSASARFVRGVAIDIEPQTIAVRPGRASGPITVRLHSG